MEELHIHLHFGPQFYKALERLAVPHGLTADIKQIKAGIKHIMSDQDVLEQKVAAIQESENQEAATLAAVKDEVDALKTAHPAIDFTSLDALLGASTANTAKADEIKLDAAGNPIEA